MFEGRFSFSSSRWISLTTAGPAGKRSALRISEAKTEKSVPACTSSRHLRCSSQSRLRYQSSSLGSGVGRALGRAPSNLSTLPVR
jgi:hypothetical protein